MKWTLAVFYKEYNIFFVSCNGHSNYLAVYCNDCDSNLAVKIVMIFKHFNLVLRKVWWLLNGGGGGADDVLNEFRW